MDHNRGFSSHFDYRSRPDPVRKNFDFKEKSNYSGQWGQSPQNLNDNYIHQNVNNQYGFQRDTENYNNPRPYSYQVTSFSTVQNKSNPRASYGNQERKQFDPLDSTWISPLELQDRCLIPEEELENLFNGMVIFRSLSENHVFLKKDQVIKDSFSRSGIPGTLKYDFDCHPRRTDLICCTLVWQERKLAHGSGSSHFGAQKRAASYLIDKLSETCFTIKAKPEYYTTEGYRKRLLQREIPGVFRIVTKEDTPDIQRIFEFIDNFFTEDTDCELVFSLFEGFSEFEPIKRHAKARGLEYMWVQLSHVSVFKRRSAQYWRDKLLNSYTMENEKFLMEPPRRVRLPFPRNENEYLLSKERSQAINSHEKQVLRKQKRELRKTRRKEKREIKRIYKNKSLERMLAEQKGPLTNEPTQNSSLEKTTQKPIKTSVMHSKNLVAIPFVINKRTKLQLNYIEEEIKAGKPISQIREFEFLTEKQKRSCINLERAWAKYYANIQSQPQSTCGTNSLITT